MSLSKRIADLEHTVRRSRQKYTKVWVCRTTEQLETARKELALHEASGLKGRIICVEIANQSGHEQGEPKLLSEAEMRELYRQ
jgi:hypothetical protein